MRAQSTMTSSLDPTVVESTLTPTFSGPFAVDQSVSVKLKRIGNVVFLEIDAASAAAAATASAVSTAVIAAAHRPAASIFHNCVVQSNSVLLPAAGKIEITTGGVIKFYLDLLTTAAWSAIGNNGWQKVSLFYMV